METRTAIRARGITKAFDDVVALAGVDLDVAPGQIHGVVGPNGAGKTTLLGLRPGRLGVGQEAGHDAVPVVAGSFGVALDVAPDAHRTSLRQSNLTSSKRLPCDPMPIHQLDITADGRFVADGDGPKEANDHFLVHTPSGDAPSPLWQFDGNVGLLFTTKG
jgi:energy-coupling factor transporter ATP-binding protein EcfA2